MEEKIIKKIEKLFALAGNNPNEKEAEAALLKAQKLMAEYGIEQSQLTGEKITYATVYSKVAPHRINNTLAEVIAKSFSCKVIIAYNHEGKRVLSFLVVPNSQKQRIPHLNSFTRSWFVVETVLLVKTV